MGGGANAVNTVAPSITGTRGGTLTATPGTWTGATSVSGQWYADGVATGNTTTSFTDSDTSKSLEYRETALPGSVVAKGFLGVQSSPPLYSETFDSYADGTNLASRYQTGATTYAATPTPNIAGWDFIGYSNSGAAKSDLQVWGGKLKQQTQSSVSQGGIVRDFGQQSVIVEWTVNFANVNGSTEYRRVTLSAGGNANAFSTITGIDLLVKQGGNVGLAGNCTLTISATGVAAIPAITLSTFGSVEKIKAKLDATAKRIWLFQNGSAVGNTAGYDLSTFTGTWSSLHGFRTFSTSGLPAAGAILYDAFTVDTLQTNSVTSAVINAQPSGAPGKKQLDFTASIGVTGATGAQYKIETEAGEFVQGWTTATFSSGTASGTYIIPDFAYEGQKLKLLIEDIGGGGKIASALTATNGYALEQPMELGMNDTGAGYYFNNLLSRDTSAYFASYGNTSTMQVAPTNGSNSTHAQIIGPDQTFSTYGNWDKPYDPAQLYPSTTGASDRSMCVLNGVQWQRTSTTARSGVAPDPTDPDGTVSGWKRAGYALSSVVGLNAAGLPTKLPDDTNLTIRFFPLWRFPTARYPFTLHYKTEPGVKFILRQSTGTISMANVDLVAGTFDLVITGDHNASIEIDRTGGPISSAFVLSSVPSFLTGSPAPDIGEPYASADIVSDFAPFVARRNMGGEPIQRFATTPIGTVTAANSVPTGGRWTWKNDVSLANQAGHKYVWVNIADQWDSSVIDAKATYYRDHLNPGVIVILEYMNEPWNSNYQGTIDLWNRVKALATTDAAYSSNGFSTAHLLYAREAKAVIQRWKTIFGAQASRVQGAAMWQTGFANWQAMLDFEGFYTVVGYVGMAPYMNAPASGDDVGNYTNTPASVRTAVTNNDQAAFNTAADAVLRAAADYEVNSMVKPLRDWIAGYSISKGLGKNAIKVASYEASQHIVVNESAWDAGLGAGMGARATTLTTAYKKSPTYAATHAYYIDQMAAKCPHLMMLFQMTGANGQTGYQWWAHMDRTGNVSDEPYATAKTKAVAYNV